MEESSDNECPVEQTFEQSELINKNLGIKDKKIKKNKTDKLKNLKEKLKKQKIQDLKIFEQLKKEEEANKQKLFNLVPKKEVITHIDDNKILITGKIKKKIFKVENLLDFKNNSLNKNSLRKKLIINK